jgi:predicted O-methyltransferase YrrM
MIYEQLQDILGFNLQDMLNDTRTSIQGEEITTLYETAEYIKPKIIVEIGASVLLGQVAKKFGGKLYSIENNPKPSWYDNMQKYGLFNNTQLIQATSPNLTKESLPFEVIDYLLIDGNHAYNSVRADYLFWDDLLRVNGRVAFHDYFSESGVTKAVTEITVEFKLEQVALSTCNGKKRLGLIVFDKTGWGMI